MVRKSSSAIPASPLAVAATSLSPAHIGYDYQDQATSFFLARSLIDRFDEIVVDRKVVEDDRFDDLSVRQNAKEIRRQFKSSDDPTRAFASTDLLTKKTRSRIDDLVRSFKRAGANAATEYRLCATWPTPTDPELLKFLEPAKADPSFPGHSPRMFRLRAELIWPVAAAPIWKPLLDAADLQRQDFIDFAGRFLIELECPTASRDFFKPGVLEFLILELLTDSIGIGRYPHQNRLAVDVAAVLQRYASRARGEGKTVRPNDVERELQLVKDFGRVEQEFPVESSEVIKRLNLRRYLIKNLNAPYVIVEGPPGSGKSWELTGLAMDLSDAGYLVARHYCYLEPGDTLVQRRITTEVMFGNLIYELVRSNPALEGLHRPLYAAGRRELEDLLHKAVDQGLISKAALIVDGVDHISRVFADSTGVAKNEIDIVEELAAVNLPDGVCLIVGSQPGAHLDPLRQRAKFVGMPVWGFKEIANLANRLGLPTQLRRAGLSSDVVREFLVELHQRSEGNPLYATFLCRFTLGQIVSGVTLDPVGGLRDAPLTHGDISIYYTHLLKTAAAGGATQPIAELLGLIDFGVTEQELKEILPGVAHHVDEAVSYLEPILAPARSQSGVRIYHESFRRFIKEWLNGRNGSIPDVLAPVIAWLERFDFFDDGRSYRFLLPTMRRAGRNRELLNLVGSDFVSRSVQAGHPRRAVEQNLSLATYTAAEELAWADLVRCAELRKSWTVCFREKLTDFDLYGRAFAAVHGPAKLAERMLFDGKPVFTTRQGLLFCALCDDADVVAPWAQYFLHSENDEDERSSEDKDWVNDALAELQGSIRLEGVEVVYRRIVHWLSRVTNPESRYFRGILKRLKQFGGKEALEALLVDATMTPEVRALVELELAYWLLANGNPGEVAEYATRAVQNSPAPGVAVEAFLLGADRKETAKRCPTLESFGVSNEKQFDPHATALRRWVDGVRIASAVDPSKLSSLESKIPGEGWYSNWLRFVIELARAEELSATDPAAAEASIVSAFANLASDTEPFKGDPRACDLYTQTKIIHDTIGRVLSLIRVPANFEIVLAHLAEISLHTTTSLNNSPGGPLIPEKFIELLMPYISITGFKAAALAEMKRQQDRVREGDELFDTLATADLLLARASAIAGESEAAEQLWQSAAIHLSAYGYRRDLSILDLTESAPVLARSDRARAKSMIAAAQPLINSVDSHTDGKETQYAPIYWAESLGKIDLAGAAYVVGQSAMRHGGVVDWRHENAFEELIDVARHEGAPDVVALLDATVPKAGSQKTIERKLATIERLISVDRELGTSLLRLLIAKARGGDSEGMLERSLLAATSRPETGSTDGEESREPENEEVPTSSFHLERFFRSDYRPIFEVAATPFDLAVAIRASRRSDGANDPGHHQLENAFGYRLVEMIDAGQETEAIRLLTALARETHFWDNATLLADMGEGLERHGHRRAAAVAFALAFARSRGGRGYLFLGDEEQLPWFLKAFELSQDDAWRTLADEVTYLLNTQGYYLGITRHLIGVFAARPETNDAAFASWDAAHSVLSHRLPRNEAEYYIFEKYEPEARPEWSIDEALVFLLLARMCHPELERKTSALAGFLQLVATKPAIVGKPLVEALTKDAPISTVLLVLQVLLTAEPAPYVITSSLQDQLRSFYQSGLFGFRVMAEQLIERAGLDLGGGRRTPTITERPVPERKRDAILSLDQADRTSHISRLWSEFPDLLAGMFHERWENSKALRDRSLQRHRASRSRGHDNLPPARFLHWEIETFEMMFHQVLEGIDAELWRSGKWDPALLPGMVQNVLPRLRLHVRRWFCRSKRPDMPLPSESGSGVTTAAPISTNDEFDGWYRCGYFERELVLRSMFHVDDDVSVMSAIHLDPAANERDPSLNPLARGSADVWLDGVDPSQWEDLTVRPVVSGPIAGLDFVRDWLGEFPILMVQPYLQVRHGLTPSAFSDLELIDTDGKPAVVFRHWQENIVGQSISQEVPRLQGCELLVRPDVFDRMSQNSDEPPVTVTFRSSRIEAAAADGNGHEGTVNITEPSATKDSADSERTPHQRTDLEDSAVPQPG